MQEARFPETEADRIATLHSLNILDTPRDDRYDRYTRITARIFDMPIALISLVGRDRQWFKSAEGFDGDETPRDISFCGHAILGDEVFEIRNTRRDSRFRDNPLVVDQPHIRFYAGAPLAAPNGHKLGTLCVIDRVPRKLSDEEKTMLKNLADMVVSEIFGHVDAESDSSNHDSRIIFGANLFDETPGERGLSLLLFDISDACTSKNNSDSNALLGEIFARLLQSHFPTARSIARIGDHRFCVLLKADKDFDDARAINRLCADAKDAFCHDDGHGSLSAFVGRIQYDPDRYASIDEVLREADGMFFRHERQPLPDETDINRFVKALVGWRKTIF
jgi:hypothetical protein